MLHRHTIGIIGTGQVGMAAASALFQQRIANELILVDLDRRRAEGEAMDLMHAQGYVGRRRVRAGGYEDLAEAEIVIVTAGVGQRPGRTACRSSNAIPRSSARSQSSWTAMPRRRSC